MHLLKNKQIIQLIYIIIIIITLPGFSLIVSHKGVSITVSREEQQ